MCARMPVQQHDGRSAAAMADAQGCLAQLDVFRFDAVGETPHAFFIGYGRTPTSPLYALYRLERAAWVLNAHTRGEEWVALSVPLAECFFRRLFERPGALRVRVQQALDETL